jgi:hypothetical protein
MIDEEAVAFYRENGYLVVADVLSATEVEELRRVTEAFVERARAVTTHDDIYDLEDSHSAQEPRVRRIKSPDRWHPAYTRMVAHPKILAVLKALWGPSVRFDVSKLNLKAAGYGAPVEWHQDWAFYPHTNDDLAAVGIMLDDVDEANGPLMVIPGSHKGPVFDHHADGPGAGRGGFLVGGQAHRRCRLDHGAPRAHRPRLGAQHLRPAAPPAAAPVPRRRRLAAPGRSGLRAVSRPAPLRRGHARAASRRGPCPPAAATSGAPGLYLREPAHPPEPLLPDRGGARTDRDILAPRGTIDSCAWRCDG